MNDFIDVSCVSRPMFHWRAVTLVGAFILAAAMPMSLAVRGVMISPVVVASGVTATGTVLLDAQAPSAGTSVVLSSSKPTIATVPSTISIPARAASGTFAIKTSSGNGGCSVIAAAIASTNVAQKALISVRPTAATGLPSITLPDTVVGGGSVQGSIVAAVPGGGLPGPVQLTSSNPSVIVPPSVTPTTNNEGAYAGSFTVQTSLVQPPGTCAIITATHGGRQTRALLRVMPVVQG